MLEKQKRNDGLEKEQKRGDKQLLRVRRAGKDSFGVMTKDFCLWVREM